MPKAVLVLLSASLAACGCPEDFYRACARGGCLQQVKAGLARDPGIVGKPDAHGRLPLHLAADKETAQALLDAGADIDARAARQMTALATAVEGNRGEVVAFLLERGAKVDPYLLGDAAGSGRLSALKALLKLGVPADQKGPAGATPLHLAAANDQVAAAEALLSAGADPNAALGSNVLIGNTDRTAPGYTFNEKDASGATPLRLAKSAEMRDLLTKHGAQ